MAARPRCQTTQDKWGWNGPPVGAETLLLPFEWTVDSGKWESGKWSQVSVWRYRSGNQKKNKESCSIYSYTTMSVLSWYCK